MSCVIFGAGKIARGFIAHLLSLSDIDFVFKTESKSQESSALFNAIKTLEKHHSVVKIGNDKPVYMKDKAFWQLYKELY